MSIDNRDDANNPGRGVLWLGLLAAVVLSTVIFVGVWIAAGDDEEQPDGAADSAQSSVPSDDGDATSGSSTGSDDTPDEGDDTIGEFIANSDDHTLLANAIEDTGLSDELDGEGPFTVFAPADSDIDPTVAAATLTNPDSDIERTVQFHIVDGTLSADDLASVRSVTTLSGDELRIFTLAGGDGLLIHNGVSVGQSTEFDNGILYSVSSLLVPTGAAAPSTSTSTTTTTVAESDETTSTVADDGATSSTTTSSTTTTAPATGELADLSNLDPIQFADSSAVIDGGSLATLDLVVDILNANPTANIEIGGHTDNIGPIGGNIRLSERRANAVRDYLISGGIDASRLTAVGYGPDQPIASNDTAEGRAANRRIEFTVT